jgi:hypothetical protein
MQPDPSELTGYSARVDLGLEKVRHGRVVEGYGDHGCLLLDRDEVLDEQQVLRPRDAKPAHLGTPVVAEKQQFCPCRRRKAQDRFGGLMRRLYVVFGCASRALRAFAAFGTCV